MPTRGETVGKIYRSFSFRNLVQLHMLDIKYPLVRPVEGEELTMFGAEQAAWLTNRLRTPGRG